MEYSRLFQRTVLVLITVTALCILYGAFVVPVLEPPMPANLQQMPESAKPRMPIVSDPQYRGLFQEGDWEQNPDALLRFDSCHIFLRGISFSAEQVQGKECTILYYPKADLETEGTSISAPAPLRIHVPEGIELRFEPTDQNSMEIGPMNWAHINGQIEGSYTGDPSTPNDDIAFHLKDVSYENGLISTDDEIDFTLGQMHCKGKGLQLPLNLSELKNKTDEPTSLSAPTGIRFIEISKLECLDFLLTREMLVTTQRTNDANTDQTSTNSQPKLDKSLEELLHKDGTLPAGLRCQGNVFLDFEQQKMTFNDKVHIYVHYGTGISDTLDCDTLEIDFHQPQDWTESDLHHTEEPISSTANAPPATDSANAPNSQTTDATSAKRTTDTQATSNPLHFQMIPQQITATGKPVTFQSSKFASSANANLLQVDLRNQRMHLEGTQETELHIRNAACFSKSLDYEFPNDQNPLGRLTAPKNGWMQTELLQGNRPVTVRLNWRGDLEAGPDPDEPSIYLLRLHSTSIDSENIGRLSAPSILVYLKKAADTKANSPATNQNQPGSQSEPTDSADFFRGYQLHQLTASEGVTFSCRYNGMDTDGVFKDVQINFEQASELTPGTASPTTAIDPNASPNTGLNADNPTQAVSPNATADAPQPLSLSKFQISADQLTGSLQQTSTALSIASLKLQGNVTIVEESLTQPTDSRVTIKADEVALGNLTKTNFEIQARGEPTEFRGRGVWIQGKSFNLNSGMNQIWADSPGTLVVKESQMQKIGLPAPELSGDLVIAYGKLNFNGLLLQLSEKVSVTHPASTLEADRIDLELASRFDLTDPDAWHALRQLEKEKLLDLFHSVTAVGSVSLFGQNVKDGKRTQLVRLNAGSLQYLPSTGDIRIAGSIFSQVYFYEKKDTAPLEETTPATPAVATDASQIPHLRRMDIKCNGPCTGNTNFGTYQLLNGISLISDLVDDWNSRQEFRRDPTTLSENGYMLDANKLEIGGLAISQTQKFDFQPNLNAMGNIQLESRRFSARAQRLSASFAKAQVILEGDSVPAHITLLPTAKNPGANMKAKTIQLNTETLEFRGDGISMQDSH